MKLLHRKLSDCLQLIGGFFPFDESDGLDHEIANNDHLIENVCQIVVPAPSLDISKPVRRVSFKSCIFCNVYLVYLLGQLGNTFCRALPHDPKHN